jgi:hypothetical protein
MKKIIIIFIVTVLFTIHNLYSQNTPNDLILLNHLAKSMVNFNPENSKNTEEIITFLLKYSDRSENPTQNDIDKVLANLGVSKNVSRKDVAKEEVFSLIYFFIKNSERKITNNSVNLSTNGTPEKEKVKSIFNTISYTSFRDKIKAVNPKVSDTEIQKLYVEMQEKLKNI